MAEDDPGALVAIAERRRRRALRIEGSAGGVPVDRARVVGDWVDVVHLRLDAATAAELQLPAPVEVTLRVSAEWLREPVPAPPSETHRVDIRPSPATQTTASLLGAAASAHLTWSLLADR